MSPTISAPAPSRLNATWIAAAKLVIMLAVAVSGAYTTFKLAQQELTMRVSAAEQRLNEVVPRKEHEQKWGAIDDKLNSILLDVREIRQTQVQTLRDQVPRPVRRR